MITGKLSNGYKFKVDENAIMSAEFRDILAETVSEDSTKRLAANSELLKFLIGPEEKQKLYAMIREKDKSQYVSIEKIDALTIELMGQLEKKNKKKK